MNRKTYRMDDGDHISIMIGLLWLVGIIVALGIIASFR